MPGDRVGDALAASEAGGQELELLRRNVYYSLSWNPSNETTAWLRELERREERRLGRLIAGRRPGRPPGH
jgi:hypothetical protein